MQRVLVLGAGMVGAAMAADLSDRFAVTLADIDADRLAHLAKNTSLRAVTADLRDSGVIGQLCVEADLVIGAVPGHMGEAALRAVIDAGRDIVDISFFDEAAADLDSLNALALERGVTAVFDCGVAPGMSNILLGHHLSEMQVESFACYVGGLPVERALPWQYKAPFSPVDVLQEYIRPARLVEHGEVVIRPPMSEPEMVKFAQVGTLEACNTDGLRSLLGLPVPHMKEKTMRWPGHYDLVRSLRDSGFLDTKPISVGEGAVLPLNVTARLLLPLWRLEDGEEEFTAMRVLVTGNQAGRRRRITWELFDRTTGGVSSMARTTGYTATAVASLALGGTLQLPGLHTPETLGGQPALLPQILDYLSARGVIYHRTDTSLDN
ncbi:MAG: saccharopine dehydrogenase NADP-binding domain-containing protein [Candidatus Cloacimonetes bacterium]|nr:saccharopine dehydrogenase NADP-binding domain-containing protein [Candidatus Cloacimonadota bacterium]